MRYDDDSQSHETGRARRGAPLPRWGAAAASAADQLSTAPRAERPDGDAILEALAMIFRIPVAEVGAVLSQHGAWKEVSAMGEEFLHRIRQVRSGEITNFVAPSRLPTAGEYFSFRYRCPKYLVDHLPDA